MRVPGRTSGLQEKPRQLRQRLVRRLLGQEVAARERVPAHVGGPPLPGFEHLAAPAALAPQGEHRALDAPAGREIRRVQVEVDRRPGAIVLARRVDDLGLAEAAQVLGEGII